MHACVRGSLSKWASTLVPRTFVRAPSLLAAATAPAGVPPHPPSALPASRCRCTACRHPIPQPAVPLRPLGKAKAKAQCIIIRAHVTLRPAGTLCAGGPQPAAPVLPGGLGAPGGRHRPHGGAERHRGRAAGMAGSRAARRCRRQRQRRDPQVVGRKPSSPERGGGRRGWRSAYAFVGVSRLHSAFGGGGVEGRHSGYCTWARGQQQGGPAWAATAKAMTGQAPLASHPTPPWPVPAGVARG